MEKINSEEINFLHSKNLNILTASFTSETKCSYWAFRIKFLLKKPFNQVF